MAAEPSAAAAPAAAGGAHVVDTYEAASKLVEGGVTALSRVVVGAVQAQVESSSAELKTLEKATHIAATAYAEVKDNVKDVAQFHANAASMVAELAPHFATVDELDKVVAELEEAARTLDAQTRQLEQAFTELL